MFFIGSGIDLDGGDDQVGLVSNPSTVQMFSNSEPMSIKNSPDNSQSTEGGVYPHSHRETTSSHNRRNLDYSKMPNSCRVNFDFKVKQNSAIQEVVSARSWYLGL